MTQENLFGIIERITYHNPENGFTVAKLKQPKKQTLVTLVGAFPALQPGESVRCSGQWKNNSTHGIQFEVETCHIEAPADIEGIQKYLESGMVQGIGPVYAERIVKQFGLKTLDIIDQTPDALLEIPGIGAKRVEKIKSCWSNQKTIRDVMLFLQKYGISPAYAQKIFRVHGEDAVSKVQENPFHLAKSIPGIGFKMADKIAEKMGFSHETPGRIDAGIDYVLHELAGDGHACFPLEAFLESAKEMLGVEPALIKTRLQHLQEQELIFIEEGFIWSKGLYLCEKGIAYELKRLLKSPCKLRSVNGDKAIEWVESQLRIFLAPNQKEAVKKSLEDKVHIITGGPGTGKSTITKAILAITGMLTRRIILAAPTGRAAKRMTEITKTQASTIHSLLQYDFAGRGFKRNRENPLECDLIIIDEASMIDTGLMYHLLKAIPSEARILLVGDIHQLPSVGPGNVLKDLIESEKIAVTYLTEIFRQAAGSKIITNAHKILQGEFPDLYGGEKSDFFFLRAEEAEEVKDRILSLVSKRLPSRYRFDPIDDIQVLAPMKKGVIGTENLNLALQETLNPSKNYFYHGGHRFCVGDKVMQIRNNYNKEIFNGDIGRIVRIDQEEQILSVRFEDKEISYFFYELDELILAYATSIHKYQGSECPCIVIPIHTSHFMMLHRNLFYTGVTRGKKLVVVVGLPKAIAIAVGNDEVKKRHTYLKEQIKKNLL